MEDSGFTMSEALTLKAMIKERREDQEDLNKAFESAAEEFQAFQVWQNMDPKERRRAFNV